ncbi:hypothetical protein LCGC14_2447420, partial [marine sediment metagenome]
MIISASILMALERELDYQDAHWGFKHDEGHDWHDWASFIDRYLNVMN